jgi:PEGA domain
MIRKLSAVLLLTTAASVMAVAQAAPTAPPVASVNAVLADGTPIKLHMGNVAAANAARIGENIELEVAEEVRVAGTAVIAKGNVASAEVTGIHAGLGSGIRLDINLRSVMLADNQIIPVRSTKERPNRDSQALVISSASQDASIAPGTTVIAFVDGEQKLDLTRLRAASGPTQTLKVNSTPTNAEVSVDGHQTGSTPYVFHVPAGEHTVVIRMVGFQPWQGTVHVNSEPANVEATLVKQDGMESVPVAKTAEASLGDLARAARARKAQANAGQSMDVTQQIESDSGKRDPMQPVANNSDK